MLFLGLVFAVGGGLAPWVWWGAQAASGFGSPGVAAVWTDHPFHRFVHRCLLAVALLGLVPFVRAMGVRTAWTWPPLVSAWRWEGRRWCQGFGVGAGMFAAALVAEQMLGTRTWRDGLTSTRVLSVALSAGLAGVVVAGLEELLFRGVVCRSLGVTVGWPAAILISSALYAWVHFLGKVPSPDPITWTSGWWVVAVMVQDSLDVGRWMPGMPTLLIAGVWLARVMQRTGSLWMPMGLHAGWVSFIKLRSALTRAIHDGGGGSHESRISAGWTGLVAVLAGWVIYEAIARRRTSDSARRSSDSV